GQGRARGRQGPRGPRRRGTVHPRGAPRGRPLAPSHFPGRCSRAGLGPQRDSLAGLHHLDGPGVGPEDVADLDTHLVAIGTGDRRALAAWCAGAEMSLRASLRRYATVVDAEAVLQETLLRVWQLASGVQPDGAPNALLRLAMRIARNLAIDEVRRRG